MSSVIIMGSELPRFFLEMTTYIGAQSKYPSERHTIDVSVIELTQEMFFGLEFFVRPDAVQAGRRPYSYILLGSLPNFLVMR